MSNEARIDPTWCAIEAFLRQTLSLHHKQTLTRQTRLNYDLGVDGDDADAVMNAFFIQFEVAHGDYDWVRYFGMEGLNPFAVLYDLLRRKPPPLPLKIGMLEMAAKNKCWDTAQLERLL
jgi:LPS sulfotransferase NodH